LARIRADARGGQLPEPTHVVRSSPRRFQVLWSVPRGELDHARAEALTKGLAARYRADTQVIDVARVLRLPGYRNWKRGGTPCRLVSVFQRARRAGVRVFVQSPRAAHSRRCGHAGHAASRIRRGRQGQGIGRRRPLSSHQRDLGLLHGQCQDGFPATVPGAMHPAGNAHLH